MDEKKVKIGGIVVVACFVLLVFVPNYAQFQLSPLAHLVMPAYSLDQTQFAMLFSAPMAAGIFFSMVAGLLCDQFGVKRVVGIAVILSAIALVARIFAPDFVTFFICMIAAGLSVTFLNANISKIMGSWFTSEKLGLAVGISMAGGTLAMAIGMGTSALFPSLHSIFVFTAILAVAAVAVWWIFYKEGPLGSAGTQGEAQDAALATPPLTECVKVVTKSRNVWLIGVILAMCMAENMCLTTFMPQILAARGFDTASAGAVSSILTYGGLAGALASPIIRARFGAFRPIAVIYALVAAVTTATAWMLPEGPLMVIGFFLAGFAANGLLVLALALPILLPEIGPVYAGTAGGLVATLQLIGAVVLPTYILTPLFGDNYLVFYLIAGAFGLVAAVCSLALPELFGKDKAE